MAVRAGRAPRSRRGLIPIGVAVLAAFGLLAMPFFRDSIANASLGEKPHVGVTRFESPGDINEVVPETVHLYFQYDGEPLPVQLAATAAVVSPKDMDSAPLERKVEDYAWEQFEEADAPATPTTIGRSDGTHWLTLQVRSLLDRDQLEAVRRGSYLYVLGSIKDLHRRELVQYCVHSIPGHPGVWSYCLLHNQEN